jgi:hypothetical protein
MANRFPLIVDSAALQIKELPNGDNIDMTGSGITSATSIGSTTLSITEYASVGTALTVSGNLTASTVIADNITADIGIVTSLSVSGVSTLGTVQFSSGIVTATSGVVTYYGDGSKLSGISAGSALAISEEGSTVGSGITTINFVGSNVTATAVGSTATITVTSTGGGGAGLSTTGISTAAIWSNPSVILTSIGLTEGNNNYGAFGPITVSVGATVTVGAANTFVIV